MRVSGRTTSDDVAPIATASEEPESAPGKADMSDEGELEKALQYRKHAFKKEGGKSSFTSVPLTSTIRYSLEIDLVHIARTSAAVAGAPRLSNGIARRPSQDNKVQADSSDVVCLDCFSTTLC